jgi:transposase InsO family protein
VVKRDGQPQRVAIDYSQTVNIFTQKDSFPIPLIDEMVNELASFKFFASYDLRKAYHQVPISEGDKPFTAFEACGQLFEFNVIPFGVTNGGPVFQRVMTDIIRDDRLSNTFVYFDNVVIAANSLGELQNRASKFKASMRRRSMTLNESKTVYGVKELNILGYCVGDHTIKPDPERLKPLLDMPPPVNKKALMRVMGLFAYYAKWVPQFSDKIWRLKSAKTFPLCPEEMRDFESLKQSIAAAALQAIDETLPFTVECDASDIAVAATLNQNGRPVAFMSRSLSGSELLYPAVEKEATSIIEAVRKWAHLLMRRHFTLVTDQRSVAFMLDARKRTKIKNSKILCWRLELASFSYSIIYRPGKQNVGPDTLTRTSCSAISTSESRLLSLHKELCCPGVTRFWNYVRSKNLPYSLDDIKKCCANCGTCAQVKPQFISLPESNLIKATNPMERLSIDFKGPLPSVSKNKFFLCIIDEYSRYPFCFPCADISADTVIRCLERVFSLFGTCSYVHSDRGTSFMSRALKSYLFDKGIASSHTTPYHPRGNGQCERYNGILWKAMRCALKSRNLEINRWEMVIPAVLDSVRSLLCTSTGESPHARFLRFSRRSNHGKSLPDWLCKSGPVLLRNFVRSSKTDDLVQPVTLIEANPMYARIRYPDGRESNVSLRDIARCPQDGQNRVEETYNDSFSIENDSLVDYTGDEKEESEEVEHVRMRERVHSELVDPATTSSREDESKIRPSTESNELRRSSRRNKGVPPERFGDFCSLCN